MAPVDEQNLLSDDLEALATQDLRLEVQLLPDGRMRAPQQEARDLLRDRLRQAEVLPTGNGWAVLRTMGASDEPEPIREQEVVAAGVISDTGISVIDFIGFLASGYQTGVVKASHGEHERAIYFHKGDVVWATSNAPGDRLGELLVARGKITPDQLESVMRETGGRRFGRCCVERGFLPAHDVWAMVQAQLKEVFDRLIAMDAGLWSFARVSETILAESQIHLSTQGLLVDALRRLDELNVYRQRIRSAEVLMQRVDVADEVAATALGRIDDDIQGPAALILDHLQATTATVREAMRIVGRGEFDVTRVVYQLLRANLVEVVTEETGPIPRRTPVTTTVAKEVIDVYSMALREMFEDVDRVDLGSVLRKSAREFLLDDASNHVSTLYKNVRLHADGTIDAAALVESLADTDLEAQDFSDALSELMFFVLFQATELLGRRRGDNLARRVKMIHGMLAATNQTGSP